MRTVSLKVLLSVLLACGGIIVLASCKPSANAGKDLFPNGSQSTPITATGTSSTADTPKAAPQPAATPAADSEPLTKVDTESPGSTHQPPPTQADVDAAKKAGTRHVVIKTVKGTIEADLYGAETPLTVANFIKLARGKYYDGLTFHRVEPGFVIQGGDPNGDGSGGPGYTIRREVSPKLTHEEGVLAMARKADPNSAGSQFYITLAPTPDLDGPPNGPYTVFGKVTKGMDVVKKIAKGDKMTSVTVK